MKTHWKKTRNPDYFGSWSIQDGQHDELAVKIKKVSQETIKTERGSESVTLLHLQNNKPLILNTVNSKAIANILETPFIEDWVGKDITLYVKRVKAFGEWVDAVRVKDELPKDTREIMGIDHPKYQAALDSIKSNNVTLNQIESKYKLTDEARKAFQDQIK
jgi:hypothetical protein